MTVRLSSVYFLLLPDFLTVEKCLERCSAATHLSLMSAFSIVLDQPLVKVCLQLVNVSVDLFPKSRLVKLVQHRFMESFHNSICLWMPGFSPGVIDIVKR